MRATEALAHGHREWRTFTTGAISRPAFPHPCIRSMVSLDRYYAECVIGGLGSFIISVHQAEDFASRSERPHPGMERPASRCHWPINWLEEERLRPSSRSGISGINALASFASDPEWVRTGGARPSWNQWRIFNVLAATLGRLRVVPAIMSNFEVMW